MSRTPRRDYTDSRTLDDRIGALEIPLLVIFGAEDQIYDAEEAIEPYRGIAGVQAYVLEGAGHSPQVELPEETAELIEEFAAEPVAAEEQAAPEKKPAGRRSRRRKPRSGEDQATGKKEPKPRSRRSRSDA